MKFLSKRLELYLPLNNRHVQSKLHFNVELSV